MSTNQPQQQSTNTQKNSAAGSTALSSSFFSSELGSIADVSQSLAYLSLDSLLEQGHITAERAHLFKNKYKELHNCVMQIYNFDNFLLRRARIGWKVRENELTTVTHCTTVAKTDDEQITALKNELANVENNLMAVQEKENVLQVESLELDRRRRNLVHEIEDAVAAEEARLKPQIEKLHNVIKENGDRLEMTAENFKKMKMYAVELKQKEAELKYFNENESTLLLQNAQDEFVRMEKEPERAQRQYNIVTKHYNIADKERRQIKESIEIQLNTITKRGVEKAEISTSICELTATTKSCLVEINTKEATLQTLQANYKYEEENRQGATKKVQELHEMIRTALFQFNNEKDQLSSTKIQKDKTLQLQKKLEQEIESIERDNILCKKEMEIYQREEENLIKQRDKMVKEVGDLKRNVDILINEFLTQELVDAQCSKDVEAIQEQLKKLEDEVTFQEQKERTQKHSISDLAVRREQISCLCSQNQANVQVVKNDIQIKSIVLRKLKRQNEILTNKLLLLTSMCSNIKRERSNKAREIQASHQRLSEMHEKLIILENELEVLCRESHLKDQEVLKKKRENMLVHQICCSLAHDINKNKNKLNASERVELDLKTLMRNLNSAIIKLEDEMLDLKKNYEEVAENRNYTGIKLIDKNDELCILYEKSNVQKTILTQSTTILEQRKGDTRALACKLVALKRQIELVQKTLPEVKNLEDELAKILQALEDEKLREEVLEDDLTDPQNASRWRQVGMLKTEGRATLSVAAQAAPLAPAGGGTGLGALLSSMAPHQNREGAGDLVLRKEDVSESGPSQQCLNLQKTCQDLEERLTSLDEKLMEKDLLLEEVTDLSNQLRKQALAGRDVTLGLAKRVGIYQSGIWSRTKKIMATLSELSMVQASSIQLQAEVEQLDETISEARERLDAGQAPTQYHQYKYERDEQDHQERRRRLREKKAMQQTLHQEQYFYQENITMNNNNNTTERNDGINYLSEGSTRSSPMNSKWKKGRTLAETRPNAYIDEGDELGLPKPFGAHAPFHPSRDTQRQVARLYAANN